ncbi:MAG: ABC transporter permease [Anaerolineaceae bacterium]|nr:ABC transporter permease [Anaerolineaceae bacterium]
MIQFLFRRLLLLLPVMIGILLVTFAIVRLIPGDPCKVMLGERATPAKCNDFRQRFGLNESIPVQFVRYLDNIVHGDFGVSLKTGQNVVDIIAERLPMTIELSIAAMLFATIVGIFLGVTAAIRRNSAADVTTMLVANIGVSMPVFWLGLMLAYVFALLLKGTPFFIPPSGRLTSGMGMTPLAQYWHMANLAPIPNFLISFLSNSVIVHSIVVGRFDVLKDALWHLILPALAVGTIPLAVIARMSRSSLLEVLGQDYIRTARAKGLKERLVLFKHAFRNALIPIVTIVGLETGALLAGAVLTETVFSLPGVGTALIQGILARDYPVVQGFTVVIAIIFVLVNLVIDLSYAYLDPRIRLD